MATFGEYLRSLGDAELVELLCRRPDLATPSPATLTSLVARASGRASIDHALAELDAAHLQLLEAVVAIEGEQPDVARLVAALPGLTPEVTTAMLDRLAAAALVFPGTADGSVRPAPGVRDQFGQYPAGLMPPASQETARSSNRWSGDTAELAIALEAAPAGAAAVLDALTWGPPIGVRPRQGSPGKSAVDWLANNGLLVSEGTRHVYLPRDVSLTLRGGRTHAAAQQPPRSSDGWPDPLGEAATGEAVGAADRIVRMTAALIAAWGTTPAPVLRAGGLGTREMRRVVTVAGCTPEEAVILVEAAAAAGLITDDGEDPAHWVPTPEADDWLATSMPQRWAVLATAWLTCDRATWPSAPNPIPALDVEARRPWIPRLRAQILQVLTTGRPEDPPVRSDDITAHLTWHSPRAVPAPAAVTGLIAEARLLGVITRPGLSLLGRGLLDGVDAAAAAVAAALPPAVDELFCQADLTGVVPGRPSERLAALLAVTATVESRGGAVTVRFSPESLQAAFDEGRSSDAVIAALSEYSRGPLPQALEYMVRDTERRHGSLRVGMVTSYLRGADPAVLAELAADQRLRRLGLVLLAPTVLGSSATAGELHTALRERGLSPVIEGPDGNVLRARPAPHRAATAGLAARRGATGGAAPVTTIDAAARRTRYLQLVTELRAAEDHRQGQPPAHGTPLSAGTATGGPDVEPPVEQPVEAVPTVSSTPEPAEAITLLHQAIADREAVWIELVDERGSTQRRLLRPVRLDAGRLRALDPGRDAELTVAVHRIVSVSGAATAPEVPIAEQPSPSTTTPGAS